LDYGEDYLYSLDLGVNQMVIPDLGHLNHRRAISFGLVLIVPRVTILKVPYC